MEDKKKFNQKDYINQYKKDNYKQFKANMKPNEFDKVNKLLEEINMTKREMVLFAYNELKKKNTKDGK